MGENLRRIVLLEVPIPYLALHDVFGRLKKEQIVPSPPRRLQTPVLMIPDVQVTLPTFPQLFTSYL
jgi:hypothetical protein